MRDVEDGDVLSLQPRQQRLFERAWKELYGGMIERVSTLVAEFPEISEMDLNPVFATDQGATAADALTAPSRSRVPHVQECLYVRQDRTFGKTQDRTFGKTSGH